MDGARVSSSPLVIRFKSLKPYHKGSPLPKSLHRARARAGATAGGYTTSVGVPCSQIDHVGKVVRAVGDRGQHPPGASEENYANGPSGRSRYVALSDTIVLLCH
jgi:hypothetical protein